MARHRRCHGRATHATGEPPAKTLTLHKARPPPRRGEPLHGSTLRESQLLPHFNRSTWPALCWRGRTTLKNFNFVQGQATSTACPSHPRGGEPLHGRHLKRVIVTPAFYPRFLNHPSTWPALAGGGEPPSKTLTLYMARPGRGEPRGLARENHSVFLVIISSTASNSYRPLAWQQAAPTRPAPLTPRSRTSRGENHSVFL